MEYTVEETGMIIKSNVSEVKKIKGFKKWVPFLALVGAMTGTISLIISSVAVHKTDHLRYYLDTNGEVVWGNSTIWVRMFFYPDNLSLYFAFQKDSDIDIKWDGKYPDDYFKKS